MNKKTINQLFSGVLAGAIVVTSAFANPVPAAAATKVVTVSSQKALDKALKSNKTQTVNIKTSSKKSFTTKKSTLSKVTLNVTSPKASVTNKAKFKKILISDVNKITEKRSSNTYEIKDKKATLSIAKKIKTGTVTLSGASASIALTGAGTVGTLKPVEKATVSVSKDTTVNAVSLTKANKVVTVSTKGNVKKVDMSKNTSLVVKGSTKKVTEINVNGIGAKVTTSLPEKINLKANGTVIVNKGAENSTITVAKENVKLDVTNNTESDIVITLADNETLTLAAGKRACGNRIVDADATDALSYSGYSQKWEDEFEGTELNRENWNVETHQPGWVNNELQEYVDSDENIQVKDGTLVIQPKKDGEKITSGRINTQGNKAYTYGLFEVRAKVPTGAGYLPAFWMMPEDENLYGQWPRCGEIDCMEVMGQETDKLYGTIHFGNPHDERQGTYTLSEGTFASEYHTFSCEWEPGSIKWYVDGILYHTANDWYSTTENQGTLTYPAPFDQPFHMILNLAVGGSWVGNPTEETSYDENFTIDSVRVYQKDSYNENVSAPEKAPVELRDPDENGNYINNGDFSEAEDLSDDLDWKFLTALGGEGTASIADNTMKIETTNEGTADYSIQLVQANVPMQKGAKYKVSFKAKADDERATNIAIKAPDHGYQAYWTVDENLTSEYKDYSYEFTMSSDSDPNGRLEYNMGAKGSTSTIYIKNVKIEKIAEPDPNAKEEKVVLADGNYVYNGAFQEGKNRLGYWDIKNMSNAKIGVSNLADGRRLQVTVSKTGKESDVTVSQSDMTYAKQTELALSFDAQADVSKEIKIVVDGKTYKQKITKTNKQYVIKFVTNDKEDDNKVKFYLGTKGKVSLDNVRIVEDALIKNGSFNAGLTGYEFFKDGSADASIVVDSLSEDNAADITIKDTGDADWKIQLKQNNVELVKDQWYRLKLSMKSSIERDVMYAIQRDGSSDDDWTPYTGTQKLTLDGTNKYEDIELEFKMSNETDKKSIFTISLGAVNGKQITTQHRVCIDNISLEKIDAPSYDPAPLNENLLTNADFATGDATGWKVAMPEDLGSYSIVDVNESTKGIKFAITGTGVNDYDIKLSQEDLQLEPGAKYKATFDVVSTKSRIIKASVMNASYAWFGGADIELEENVVYPAEFTFTKQDLDKTGSFNISMGKIADVETPASDITIYNIKLVKVEE